MEGEVSFLQTRSTEMIVNPILVSLHSIASYYYKTANILTMPFVAELRAGWEVPSIAHYCEIFHKPFRLPEFDVDVSITGTLKLAHTIKLHIVCAIQQGTVMCFVYFFPIQLILCCDSEFFGTIPF